ncbi:MAG: phosphoribosylaminoimidazolesuccinocarboxamide synthase [Nitrospirota bacterium]
MENVADRPVVLETYFDRVGTKRRGKVRDIYDLGEYLLLVATDRISAFDVVLPDGIPGKGYVLTQLSKFWFEWLWEMEDVLPHHLITTDVDKFPPVCRAHRDVLQGRSMLVGKYKPLPVECIVRGYLAGSGWREYRESGTVCGQRLPPGLKEADRLPQPIFTPSTKATSGHDENVSFEQMESLIGVDLARLVRQCSLTIYQRAAAYAEALGIIIADTKMEFGLEPETGQPYLIDEVLTPDSSRFWPKDQYQPGSSPPSFDKQYVRDYLDSIGWNHQPPGPTLPPEVIRKTSEKYVEALTRLTATG